jgi:ABC-type transport system involved in multi-copper enzyme maturation permease subunit
MDRIWAIALNTFREAVRDRVLYGVVGFGALVQLFALALGELALDEQARVVRDVGIATVSLFSVIVAVFLGSSLLYKEIERKTLYVILPKPIRRDQFLLGKYFGIVLTAAVFIALMGGLQLWLQAFETGQQVWAVAALPFALALVIGLVLWKAKDATLAMPTLALLVLVAGGALAWACGSETAPVAWSLALILGEVVLLAAVALLFSSFSTPFLTGAFTVGVWLLGRGAGEMASMESTVLPATVRAFLHGLAWVVPNFHLFVPNHRLLSGLVEGQTPSSFVGIALLYGVLYASVLLAASTAIFRRRDFI